jgi:TolB-like protein
MNLVRRIVSRPALAGLLFLALTAGAYAQDGRLGKIAILPFSGGSVDEQEGIAELLSFTQEMMQNFSVIPRTGITNAARQEQSFQATSGMTDADTIARLGNQFGADYVMAGSITALGYRNLLIVSIIRIDVIRQVAGVYLIYDSLDALNRDETILKDMAAELVEMTRGAEGGLDRLALLPVELSDGGNKQEGDALAQLLSIHLLRAGKYAVYPRTESLEQVQGEYKTQLEGGVTREDEAVRAGEAENPPYVLSVISRKIGTGTRFNASIIDLELGSAIKGESELYSSMSDGVAAMEFLAMKLSDKEISARDQRARTSSVSAERRTEERAEAARRTDAAIDNFLKNSGIAFGGRLGFGLGGDAPTSPVKDKETGEVKNVKEPILNGGADLALRLYRYFGIQTGVYIIGDFATYTGAYTGAEKEYEKLTIIQIPILIRLEIPILQSLYIAGFGGIGVNAAVATTHAKSANPGGINFIAGGELGAGGTNFSLFTGYQFNGSMSMGSININETMFDYAMAEHILYFGIRIYIPFRK